jgi:hypothetical protein
MRAVSAVAILDSCGSEGQGFLLRLSGCNIKSDHIQVVAGGFERLLGIMVRNKSGVIIKGRIAFPAQAVKDDQQTGMCLVHARTTKSMIAMWCPG